MDNRQLVELITAEVVKALKETGLMDTGSSANYGDTDFGSGLLDIASKEYKDSIQIADPENQLAINAMRRATTARVGIGRSGPRLNTKSLISLRADHAMAKDAVMKAADENILKQMNLPVIQSQAREINEHLTRPDLGRKLPQESVDFIKQNCVMNPQVQIYVSDGLSNSAIDENIREILPVLMDGLKERGVSVGTPFFVKFGRVPTMDVISEITGADVTVVLLGERPGLAAADSMSAYMAYKAEVGMPESRRTVVSNIHKNGIQPVEAGAYLVEIIEKMLATRSSGVDLVL
mgnify:FL=1